MIDAEHVKEQSDIKRVVGAFGIELKRGGSAGELVGLCPFHKEKSPSFTVTPAKGCFYCFGCQAGGDSFAFVQKIESLSFGKAVERVAEICGVSNIPTDAPTRQKKPEVAKTGNPKVTATYPYIDEHGELLMEVQRIEPGRNGKAKEFRQRRPHPMDGAWVWGIKEGRYRRDQQGDWRPVKEGDEQPEDDELPEVRRVLFRLPEVLAAEEVWLVEGEKDALTLAGLGVIATTTSGGAGAPWQAEFTEALRGKRVIIIPDNDEPGKKRVDAVTKLLVGAVAELIIIRVDAEFKDVTEAIEGGKTLADLQALVDIERLRIKEEKLAEIGLLSPAEIIANFAGGVNTFLDPSKRKPGLNLGFSGLHKMTLGLQGGELMILAARPGQGKTALAMNIATNVAETGGGVAVFSLEMSAESLLWRIVCARARVNSMLARMGQLHGADRNKLARAFTEICEMPLFIDDKPATTTVGMKKKLLRMKKERGKLSLVVIDYLQLMSGSKNSAKENRNQEVSEISRSLKVMSREFDVPFIALSQLSRATETRVGNHRPQLSDLRESGSLEQDADLVGFIFREEVYKRDRPDLRGNAELIIAKQRNGPIGTVGLTYLHSYTRFEDRAGDPEPEN